ncbi:MAG: EAL domain-containing protein [Lachnospiraceae bacterium]|nr:EAL domain-containing protein [Lachnospiraceae bacterium]
MERILYFDYCAIPIFLIILFATYMRRTTRGAVNRLFLTLVWLSLATVLVDVASETLNAHSAARTAHPVLVDCFHYLYFSLRNAAIWVYLIFIYANLRTLYQLRGKLTRLLIGMPYAVLLCVLFTNPLHQMVFHIDPIEGYQRGPLISVLYLISFFYAFYGIVYLFHYRNYLPSSKWWPLLSFYIFVFISILIQLVFPFMIVEMFATSLVFLLVILLVLRPEDITDSSVGRANWQAYKDELHKITAIRQSVQIISIRFLNAIKVRSYLGEELFSKYIKNLAESIEHFCEAITIHYELYYEAPVGFYLVVDEKQEDWNAAEVLPQLYEVLNTSTKEAQESGARLEAKLCVIRFPEDLEGSEDIIKLGHDFYGLIPYERSWAQASEIIGTQRYKIENQMDTILNRAIREQRFEMFYQPIYNLKEDRFYSAEALIRLRDELFGQISPGIFIPAAETKGLILPIGNFVLEAVFKFIAENNIEELGLSYIEINLSVAQCMQRDLPDLVRYLQEKYEVSPSQVNFEIVETTYDDIGNIADKNIRTLVEMGYTFSLDDYGTGYSNIQRIATLPLEIIKIDKSLVDNMGTEKGGSILKNAIRMMKDIGKELVAEGVETKEDVETLRKFDCDFIQGFYYSKPLPGDEFINFIREKRLKG